jgi:uncharacterized membrane protein YeiB
MRLVRSSLVRALEIVALMLDVDRCSRAPISALLSPSDTARATSRSRLTFYLFDSIMVAVILHHDLLGLGAHVDSLGALGIALGVWLVAVALAARLDRAGRPAPADALIRQLVYRR